MARTSVWVRGAVAAAGLLALAMLFASLLPYRVFARLMSEEFFELAAFRLRVYGLLLAGLAVLGGMLRERLASFWQPFGARCRKPAWADWRQEWPWLAALAVLCVLGTALRAAHLADPFRCDEGYTFLKYVKPGLFRGVFVYADTNNHPLNSLLMRLGLLAFGNQEWALRLGSLAAGALLPAAVYWFSRVWVGCPAAALWAAAAAASSSLLAVYSVLARGYAVQALLLVAMTAAILALRGNTFWWVVHAAAMALGFFALPTMLYPAVGFALWLLLAAGRERWADLMRAWLLTAGGVLILYLPILVASGPVRILRNRWIEPLPSSAWAREFWTMSAETWQTWHRDWPPGTEWLLTAGFLLALLRRGTAGSWKSLPLCLTGAGLAIAAVQRVAPFPRVWLFLLPVLLVTAAAGLRELWRSAPARWSALPVVVLASIQMLHLARPGHLMAWDEAGNPTGAAAAAHHLLGILEPGDAVLAVPPANWVVQYYLSKAGLPGDLILRDQAARWVVVAHERDGGLDGVLKRRGFLPLAPHFERTAQLGGTSIWVQKR
jgi:hypothetical protein